MIERMLPKNVICLSSIDWDFNWQNPQEVASAFAEAGERVLFIENTGVRRSRLRDLPRLWKRLNNWIRARGRVSSRENGIGVYSPVLIPLPFSRVASFINRRILLRVIRRWVAQDAGRPLLFVTFLPTPLARDLIRATKPHLVVFYRIDRIEESSPAAERVRLSEPDVIAGSDLVLLTAENLRTDAMRGRRVELLPSGVRFRQFAEARRAGPVSPVFAQIRAENNGPIAGFAGSLRDQLDLRLLEQVVASMPELNFVFVGPIQTSPKKLAVFRNFHMIDAVPHDELIRTMKHFDAGILPYALDDYTAGIMPAKLKEYLASGLPVVSTMLPEVCRFAKRHPGMVDFASDAPAFVEALRSALSRNTPEDVERRLDVARQYEWSTQLANTNALIERLMIEKC